MDSYISHYNEWEVIEDSFTIENNYKNETLFALGNGYLGLRGNLEEGYSGPKGTGLEGTYINGFFETENIKYGEIAYGFPEKSQTMLNITNGKKIRVFVEDEEFNILTGHLSSYKRTLSMKEGTLKRSLIWTSPKGRTIKADIERIVHFKYKHLAVINYKITPMGSDLKLQFISSLDGNVTNLVVENDPRVGSGLHGKALSIESLRSEDGFGQIRQKTNNSGQTVVCSMEHTLHTNCNYICKSFQDRYTVNTVYDIDGVAGETVSLTKYLVYCTSHDYDENILEQKNEELLNSLVKSDFKTLRNEQISFLKDFWHRCDISIKGDPALQQGIHFNLFHLLQSASRDGKTSLAAKGLPERGMKAIISGILRFLQCLSLPIRTQKSVSIF